jgi:hypothetical protein
MKLWMPSQRVQGTPWAACTWSSVSQNRKLLCVCVGGRSYDWLHLMLKMMSSPGTLKLASPPACRQGNDTHMGPDGQGRTHAANRTGVIDL